MYLNEIFKDAPNILIEQISCDSRVPMKNCIYFCIAGVKYDGHDYIEEAINNGAKVIIYTKDIDTSFNAIYIKVKNINTTLSNVAKQFYKFNTNDFDIFVTCGCFGKSCVSSYIKQLINNKDLTSSIGAYGINFKQQHLTYPTATLTLIDNYKYLSMIKEEGCKYCILETNALTVSYNKLEGINPKAFVYTTTSQYSKDYKGFSHKYFDSIRKYLYTLEESTLVILNRDDISYNELINACGNNVITYGSDKKSTYHILNDKYYIDKTTFDLEYDGCVYHINSPLITKNNIYNLVASIASIVETKALNIDEVISNISNLTSPEGIYEKINSQNKNIIIDYCYSIDSYFNIAEYCKKLENINKIYIVMSADYAINKDTFIKYFYTIKDISFLTILTENNIYDQDIHKLLDVASECAIGYNILTIEDRELAIKTAIDLLDSDDLLLILDKGNEKYLNKNFSKVAYKGDSNIVYEYLNND